MRKYLVLLVVLCGCGDDGAAPDAGDPVCENPIVPFETGDPVGHAQPLGAIEDEARAGRLVEGQLPPSTFGMLTWEVGDFVLANDRIALVIEDVDDSDLYDPWGGRPVGLARVSGGAMVQAADFGEHFFMVGPSTILTTSVTVMNDGSDGGAAIVRAAGRLRRIPFLDAVIGTLLFDGFEDMEAAIDYVLEPNAESVEVIMHVASPRTVDTDSGFVLHGFMFTQRMNAMVPGRGFTGQISNADWVQLIDDDATSWAYNAGERIGSGIAQSGFVGGATDAYTIPACSTLERRHAQIVIGGPGLDGLEQARARVEGRTLRAISGVVSDGGGGGGSFRVHAVDAAGNYLTHAVADAEGNYVVHVPADTAVTLTAYRRGWLPAEVDVAADATAANITVPQSGTIQVTATDLAGALPVRVQVVPRGASTVPVMPEAFGEPSITSGRLHVDYPLTGETFLPVPAGDWTVIVSRGYEYEVVEADVTVGAGETVPVIALMDRVVDTTGVQCGDFHIHTRRSNDSGDDPTEKLRSALADGLELPVRTEHEYVDSFQPLIEELGLGAWAFGIGSVEMTSFQIWGHMNVFPLDPDPTRVNAGAPLWQSYPTADDPDAALETLNPIAVFEAARARPEAPTIIINHPTGGTEYFDYAGFDRESGLVDRPEYWDEEFTLVEIFNDASWQEVRNGRAEDWFALLDSGRPIFAVGSSDSHGISSSPVGYPRTCIEVGTDTPSSLGADQVRDQLAAGHATVSGGIYLDVSVGAAGPGDTATGTTTTAQLSVKVQAATWVDVDALEIVVDGVGTVMPIEPGDADPLDPVIRFEQTIPITVAAGGSWVVVGAYGDADLEPVHPGSIPFAASNPIWLEP